MNRVQLKKAIHSYLENADEAILRAFYQIIREKEVQTDVVGFEPSGQKITVDKLIERIRLAEKDILTGRVHTQEEAENYIRQKFSNE